MHTAAKLCLLAAAPLLASAQDFEWAGVFDLDGAVSPSKWSMQAAADGTYPDQSMKIVIIPTSTPDAATLASLESDANTLVAGTCTAVADAASMTPDAAGSCFTLTVGSGNDSEFDIVTTDLAGVAVFAQHVPIEFERDRHYFYDSAATPADGSLSPSRRTLRSSGRACSRSTARPHRPNGICRRAKTGLTRTKA